MLAFFAVFEHLSNVRRLFNRFHILYTSPTRTTTTTTTKSDEQIPSNIDQDQQREILLGPILNNILSDNRLNYFDEEFQDDLHKQEYFARELDACLLEMREIERDIFNLKQRQCYFYERYLDFIEKKDQLTEMFIDYHDEYILNNTNIPDSSVSTKQSRKRSIKYEFNIPVSNRFDLLKRQHTKHS